MSFSRLSSYRTKNCTLSFAMTYEEILEWIDDNFDIDDYDDFDDYWNDVTSAWDGALSLDEIFGDEIDDFREQFDAEKQETEEEEAEDDIVQAEDAQAQEDKTAQPEP